MLHPIFRPLLRLPIVVAKRNALIVNNIRFLQSHASEVILQKYKDKLNKKAKEVGAKDYEDLKEKLKDEIEKKKKELSSVDLLAELDSHLAKNESSSNPNVIKINKPLAPPPKEDKPPFKTLKSYVDVDKISALEPDQISLIWRARFQSNPQNVCSAVPLENFEKLYSTARQNPNFILPLKKENQGHELHFVQWNFTGPKTTHVIFTTLAEYKLHGEFSKPHTTLTFHKELADLKKIVLMNGLIEKEANVSLSEAQLLILNLQNFYGGLEGSESKLELLKAFNTGSDKFSIDALIKESRDVE